jgi:hypothetical protein
MKISTGDSGQTSQRDKSSKGNTTTEETEDSTKETKNSTEETEDFTEETEDFTEETEDSTEETEDSTEKTEDSIEETKDSTEETEDSTSTEHSERTSQKDQSSKERTKQNKEKIKYPEISSTRNDEKKRNKSEVLDFQKIITSNLKSDRFFLRIMYLKLFGLVGMENSLESNETSKSDKIRMVEMIEWKKENESKLFLKKIILELVKIKSYISNLKSLQFDNQEREKINFVEDYLNLLINELKKEEGRLALTGDRKDLNLRLKKIYSHIYKYLKDMTSVMDKKEEETNKKDKNNNSNSIKSEFSKKKLDNTNSEQLSVYETQFSKVNNGTEIINDFSSETEFSEVNNRTEIIVDSSSTRNSETAETESSKKNTTTKSALSDKSQSKLKAELEKTRGYQKSTTKDALSDKSKSELEAELEKFRGYHLRILSDQSKSELEAELEKTRGYHLRILFDKNNSELETELEKIRGYQESIIKDALSDKSKSELEAEFQDKINEKVGWFGISGDLTRKELEELTRGIRGYHLKAAIKSDLSDKNNRELKNVWWLKNSADLIRKDKGAKSNLNVLADAKAGFTFLPVKNKIEQPSNFTFFSSCRKSLYKKKK